jgi:hypothetical protein
LGGDAVASACRPDTIQSDPLLFPILGHGPIPETRMRSAIASMVVAGLFAFGPNARCDEPQDDDAKIEAIAAKLPAATSSSLRRLLSEKIEIPDVYKAQPAPLRAVYLNRIRAQAEEEAILREMKK